MSYRIAVTMPGFNVLTETGLNNYIFHSDYNTFKIIAAGSTDITVNSGVISGTYTIAHSQSYTPLVYAFGRMDSSDKVIVPNEEFDILANPPTDNFIFDFVSADAANIRFRLTNTDVSSHVYHIRYYIFEVPL